MFSGNFIIKKRVDFLKVRGGGVCAKENYVVVQAAKRCGSHPFSFNRFGYTATKKIGNAVIRNRCKRRLRAASFQLFKNGKFASNDVDWVFIARNGTADCSFHDLLFQIERSVNKLEARLAHD